MELLAALLISVSMGCIAYLIIRFKAKQQIIANRLKFKHPGQSLPYAVPKDSTKEPEVLLKSSKWDKKTKKLLDAGLRGKKNIRIYQVLRLLSFTIPFVIIAIAYFKKHLDKNMLLYAVGGGVFFFYLTRMFIVVSKKRRQRAILRSIPQFLDLLVVCVEAGLGFTAALERVLKEMDSTEPLTQEFSLMYSEFLRGLSLGEACDRLDARCKIPDLSLLLSAIVQSDQMGTSLGKSLRVQAADMRDKYRQRLRTRAMKIPVKILGPVVLVFLNVLIFSIGPAVYNIGEKFDK